MGAQFYPSVSGEHTRPYEASFVRDVWEGEDGTVMVRSTPTTGQVASVWWFAYRPQQRNNLTLLIEHIYPVPARR